MSRVLAVILAGGEGRRMGGDKPLRPFGRTTLIECARELARSYSPDIALALRAEAQLPGLIGMTRLIDDPAIAGPMAGLKAALEHARANGFDRVLTLPCDTPFLPRDLLDRLEAGLAEGANVAAACSGGRLHPVCALWRIEVLPALTAQVRLQQFSLRRLAEIAGLREVEWPTDGGDPFGNANTPEELEALRLQLGSRR